MLSTQQISTCYELRKFGWAQKNTTSMCQIAQNGIMEDIIGIWLYRATGINPKHFGKSKNSFEFSERI